VDRNREIQKKSEIIQSYFNKLGISKVRDLATVDPNKSTDAFQAFGSYRTNVESFTSIDQSRMMRYRQYEQMCVTLDTKIDLLDNRSISLADLIKEYEAGKNNWVYSIDTNKNNEAVPGKIEWAGITRRNTKLVEVFIDSGKSIRCTPDHSFMLPNGTYKEAKDLQPDESLMPKYNIGNPIKITKVEKLDITEDTGCITVAEYHNFSVLDSIYIKNCYVPELNGGIELYADDSSLYNEQDKTINIESDNQEVVDALDNLFFKSLDLNSVLWHIVYNTCKYGDSFYEVIPDNFKNPRRIKYLRFIPPQFVGRKERDGNLLEFIVKVPEDVTVGSTSFTSSQSQEISLKPWQIVHFRLDDKEFEPYGKSVLEPGRLAFKQMKLIEDAMLIYRISRAPERRVFNIPVGNLTYREAMARVGDFQQKYRKTPWIDPQTGEISYKENPLSINDDFFLPKRPDGSGVTIEYLPGGQQLGEIDDVRYFKEKILRTMRIPIAYLTGELQGDVAKTSLAAMDVRFAKTIERVQKQIVRGLEKIATIELAFKRFSIDDLMSFILKLTPASKIYELQTLEMMTQRINVIQAAMNLKDEAGNLYLPTEWMYKNINHFTDQEISVIKLMQQAEAAHKAEIAAGVQAAAGGAEGGGGGAGGLTTEVPPGAGLGGAPGGGPGLEAGALPGAEAGGAAVPPGGEIAPAPGGEAGGPAPEAATTPAAGGGGAELAIAGRILNIAGKEFLLENENDIKKLIKYVKEQQENQKITKDKSVRKVRGKMYENHFNQLFIAGELKGLIRRKNGENNNNKKEMLED
jgi:hypothetical protein